MDEDFTAFKIALDLKKMLLAAAGIFLVMCGWWILSVVFYGLTSYPVYIFEIKETRNAAEVRADWNTFKSKRASWNLLHELAGSPDDRKMVDAFDVTDDPEEYKLLYAWEQKVRRSTETVNLSKNVLEIPGQNLTLKVAAAAGADAAALEKLPAKMTLLSIEIVQPEKKLIRIQGVPATILDGSFEKLKELREGAASPAEIAVEASRETNKLLAQKAPITFDKHLIVPRIKPAGKLRTLTWFEDRGDNPYLQVANGVKSRGEQLAGRGRIVNWSLTEQMPVLLEPLVKFLTPLLYLFSIPRRAPGCGLYLILVFVVGARGLGLLRRGDLPNRGGANRRNERIKVREAIAFTRERFVSFVASRCFRWC